MDWDPVNYRVSLMYLCLQEWLSLYLNVVELQSLVLGNFPNSCKSVLKCVYSAKLHS